MAEFEGDIFESTLLNENIWMLNEISLKGVRGGPIDQKS